MVALLHLLQLREVLVERLLVEEGGPVDPLEHRVARVAAPVGARHAEELHDADAPGGRAVRPEAEVHPVAVLVEGERLRPLRDDVVDDLDLVLLAEPLEERERLLGGDLRADEGQVGLDRVVGRPLDLLEVLGRERRLAREVVVEAVLDRGADRDLGPRVELLDHARHHVGRVVTRDLQRLRALRGVDLELRVGLEGAREVDGLAVELREDGRLGEAGADLLLHEVGDARPAGGLLLAAVGEGHLDDVGHGVLVPLGTKKGQPWRADPICGRTPRNH